MRVALIRLSAIGDILRCLPAWQNLHQGLPQIEFCAVIEDRHEFLLKPFKWIHPVVLERNKIANPLKAMQEFRAVAEQIKHCDVSLDFHGVFKSALIPSLARIPDRWGDGVHKEGAHWFQNHILPPKSQSRYEQALGLAEAFGRTQKVNHLGQFRSLRKVIFGSDAPEVSSSPERILLVPGASPRGAHKRWPLNHWLHLAEQLKKKKDLAWCLGPTEIHLRSWLTQVSSIPALPQLPFWEMAEQLMKYDHVISGDTSILHLAVVLGIPVTGLYGPSDPVIAGIPQASGKILSNQVDCSPCRDRGCQRVTCLENLKPKQVLELLSL